MWWIKIAQDYFAGKNSCLYLFLKELSDDLVLILFSILTMVLIPSKYSGTICNQSANCWQSLLDRPHPDQLQSRAGVRVRVLQWGNGRGHPASRKDDKDEEIDDDYDEEDQLEGSGVRVRVLQWGNGASRSFTRLLFCCIRTPTPEQPCNKNNAVWDGGGTAFLPNPPILVSEFFIALFLEIHDQNYRL